MAFNLSARSLKNLEGVHPDLIKVVQRAIQITDVDFMVTEGRRTKARQQQLFNAGASTTLNSRHITGHAVDLAAWVNTSANRGEVRWDWPLYHRIAAAMKVAAGELNVSIVWGGDWTTFKDGPHFELNRKVYP